MPQQGGLNAPYTRLRGPLLVGQSSDFGIAAVNGGSTAPLISFWNASEHGFYVESSAQTRYVAGSGSQLILSSAGVHIGSTLAMTSTASGGAGPTGYLVIPMTTATMSSATAPPSVVLQGGAALMFEHAATTGNGRLWIYTTVNSNWMATTGMIFTSTTT